MPKHPRTIAGVVLSTSALLLLGMPAAAEEPTAPAAPAAEGAAPDGCAPDPAAEEAPPPDADGDGMPDGEDEDADGDGELDHAADVDGDGIRDAEDEDADGDGEPDAEPQTADDVDGDGIRDTEDEDADGDGEPDADRQTADDVDGDGVPDTEDDDADGDAAADAAGEPAPATDHGAPDDGAADAPEGDAPGGGPAAAESEPEPAEGDAPAEDGCAAPEPPAPAPGDVPAAPPADGHAGHAGEVPPPPAEEAVDPGPPSLDGLPGDVLAEISAYPRTPAGSTAALVEALRPLAAAGLGADEIAAVGFGRFPVGGEATWIHDWLFPRYVPSFHTHEGIDIFAARGTPVRAPAAGAVHVSNGSIGGLAVKVVEADGTYWYLAHLDAVVAGIDGTQVPAGEVVGAVGDSGNAKGGSPHVHLQLHPQGGDPVDPKAVVDQLAAEALANVPAVLAANSGPSVVFTGFDWEPAVAVERREPGRDPILDLLLPLARLDDESDDAAENGSEEGSGGE